MKGKKNWHIHTLALGPCNLITDMIWQVRTVNTGWKGISYTDIKNDVACARRCQSQLQI